MYHEMYVLVRTTTCCKKFGIVNVLPNVYKLCIRSSRMHTTILCSII